LIGTIKSRPIKTIVTFEYGTHKYEALSKISDEDAFEDLHSRRLGRIAAVKNLMAFMAEKVPYGAAMKARVSKIIREELFRTVLPRECVQ